MRSTLPGGVVVETVAGTDGPETIITVGGMFDRYMRAFASDPTNELAVATFHRDVVRALKGAIVAPAVGRA